MKYVFVFFMMLVWFAFTFALVISIFGLIVLMESDIWFEIPDLIFETLKK